MQLVALANAFDSAFAVSFPDGSRRILDALDAAWTASSGSASERLRDSFDRACRRFIADAPGLLPPDPDVPDIPRAVLLAIAVEGPAVHAAWIGGDGAVLVRGWRAIAQTTPHTIHERFRQEHAGAEIDGHAFAQILSRTIGERMPSQDPPSLARFHAAPGDTLFAISRAGLHGRVTIEEIAGAAGYLGPAVAAESLADLASRRDIPYVAVAALRFDDD